MKNNYIYKIRHKPTGKFLKIKLYQEGIDSWKRNNVLRGDNPEWGNQLFNTHKGWGTPPLPTSTDFAAIDCEVVKYVVTVTEIGTV